MSTLLPCERGAWYAPKSDACLYCHEAIPADQVAVHWSGAEDIILHPDCAARLGCHLIADSREAQLASGEQPWARRAAFALRSALQRQEVRP